MPTSEGQSWANIAANFAAGTGQFRQQSQGHFVGKHKFAQIEGVAAGHPDHSEQPLGDAGNVGINVLKLK
jgi:hypothetical protein